MSLALKLNRRITIQQPATGSDAGGQPNTGWTLFAYAWASVLNENGAQTNRAGAESVLIRASIRIRYRTDLNERMRVLVGSTTYKINAVVPDDLRREYVDLVCHMVK